ncbi:hypothetical protein F5X97DRAFT_317712 [Nemania serpens]|nr:hypothetical protein F5X97DRAFT_317712 [Nemania serpens]
MVVLRNKSHHEHRTKKTELRSSERQRHNSTRSTTTTTTTENHDRGRNRDRSRKSPRRTRSEKTKDVVKLERVPTPLAEKRNEEEFAWSVAVERKLELAIRAKRTEKTGRDREVGLLSPDPSRSYLRTRTRSKGKAENGKSPEGGGGAKTRDGNWGENASPPVKRRCLEDDVPMIIECWQ